MIPKLSVRIVEVLSKYLVLIKEVAALNLSDTLYPNLWQPRKKTPKIDMFVMKNCMNVI